MAAIFLALLSAVTVLQVSCGTVRLQPSPTIQRISDFEERAKNVPILQEVQQQTKINLLRSEQPAVNSNTSVSLMYVNGGDINKANTGEIHSIRLRNEEHYRTELGIIINFWYPYYGMNLSGPIVAYEGYVLWYNSSGSAMSRVKEGGIGHYDVTFELSHSLPGMMGYLYDYVVYWRDAVL